MTDGTQDTQAAWYSRALAAVRDWLTAQIEIKRHFDFNVDLNLQPWHILASAAAIYLAWRLI